MTNFDTLDLYEEHDGLRAISPAKVARIVEENGQLRADISHAYDLRDQAEGRYCTALMEIEWLRKTRSKFDLAFDILKQMQVENMDTLQSVHFGYVLRVEREKSEDYKPPPKCLVAGCSRPPMQAAFCDEHNRRVSDDSSPSATMDLRCECPAAEAEHRAGCPLRTNVSRP